MKNQAQKIFLKKRIKSFMSLLFIVNWQQSKLCFEQNLTRDTKKNKVIDLIS